MLVADQVLPTYRITSDQVGVAVQFAGSISIRKPALCCYHCSTMYVLPVHTITLYLCERMFADTYLAIDLLNIAFASTQPQHV